MLCPQRCSSCTPPPLCGTADGLLLNNRMIKELKDGSKPREQPPAKWRRTLLPESLHRQGWPRNLSIFTALGQKFTGFKVCCRASAPDYRHQICRAHPKSRLWVLILVCNPPVTVTRRMNTSRASIVFPPPLLYEHHEPTSIVARRGDAYFRDATPLRS